MREQRSRRDETRVLMRGKEESGEKKLGEKKRMGVE